MKKWMVFIVAIVLFMGVMPRDIEAAKTEQKTTATQKKQLTIVTKSLQKFLATNGPDTNLADTDYIISTSATAQKILVGKDRKNFVSDYQNAKKLGLTTKNNSQMKESYLAYSKAITYLQAVKDTFAYEESISKSKIISVKDATTLGAVSLKNKKTARAKSYYSYQKLKKNGETTKNSVRMKELNSTYSDSTNYLKGIVELEKFQKSSIDATETEQTLTIKGSKVTSYIDKLQNTELHDLLEESYNTIFSEKKQLLPSPTGTFKASYYPNEKWTGEATSTSVIQSDEDKIGFSVDYGSKSPSPTISQTNGFSVNYSGVFGMEAGKYVLRAYGDDGIQVLVDGEIVVDNNEKSAAREIAKTITISKKDNNLHTVEVKQVDYTSTSALEFSITPYEENVPVDNKWMAEVYPTGKYNKEVPFVFGGVNSKETKNSEKLKGSKLKLGYGSNSPNYLFDIPATISKDNWTVALSKKEEFNGNDIIFTVRTDKTDTVQIYVDDKLQFDSSKEKDVNTYTPAIKITKGLHKITIVHSDLGGVALLNTMYTDAPANQKDYMLLDLRKPSNVTVAEINNYILSKDPLSPLVEYSQYFLDVEKEYGINGLYLVSQAILESAYGRSEIAYRKNNLFGYGAIDSSPFEGAYYFPTFKESIQNQGFSIQSKYFEPTNFRFHGYNLAGIGMYYASDSLYAKKISSIMNGIKPYDASFYNNASVITPLLTDQPGTLTKSIPYIPINQEMELPADVMLFTSPYPYTDGSRSKQYKENGKVVVLPTKSIVSVIRQDPNGWYEITYNNKKVWGKW